jgi:anti-anti-sigma factor
MPQRFRLESLNGTTVVTWTESKIVPEASGSLDQLVGGERLLLDLGEVRFLSSNALALLVSLKKRVEAAGGRLRLCGLDPDLIALLHLTKLDKLLDVFETRQEALQGF